jgi:hypothetical protein
MLNLMLKIWELRMPSKFLWLRKGLVAGCCEHGNGLSLSVEGWELYGPAWIGLRRPTYVQILLSYLIDIKFVINSQVIYCCLRSCTD